MAKKKTTKRKTKAKRNYPAIQYGREGRIFI
jgi:hypothetical protein